MVKRIEAWEDNTGKLHRSEQLALTEDALSALRDFAEASLPNDQKADSYQLSNLLIDDAAEWLRLLTALEAAKAHKPAEKQLPNPALCDAGL